VSEQQWEGCNGGCQRGHLHQHSYLLGAPCFFRQIREKKTTLAQYETMDCGKPIDEAEWDMVCVGRHHHLFRYRWTCHTIEQLCRWPVRHQQH
jgi:hypothetical protein